MRTSSHRSGSLCPTLIGPIDAEGGGVYGQGNKQRGAAVRRWRREAAASAAAAPRAAAAAAAAAERPHAIHVHLFVYPSSRPPAGQPSLVRALSPAFARHVVCNGLTRDEIKREHPRVFYWNQEWAFVATIIFFLRGMVLSSRRVIENK